MKDLGRELTLYIPKTEEKQDEPEQEIPPHNGFGDEEDSRVNCFRLILKPPKQDPRRLLLEETKLTFSIQLFTPKIEDVERYNSFYKKSNFRRFVLTYYLNEKKLMIFEPQIKNSGFRAGKFLEKGKYKNTEGKINKKIIVFLNLLTFYQENVLEFIVMTFW